MTVDRGRLFSWLAGRQPEVPPSSVVTAVLVPALVKGWLDAGPSVFTGEDRVALAELCRQVDVRKKVSVAYAEGWKRLDAETPADKAVMSGLAAVLLAQASDGVDGWALKCVNSALKAIDLDTAKGAPRAAALRAWAMEILDRVEPVEVSS